MNMDRAMAFILALLAEFNNESVKEFLDRCWRIVSGNALDNDIEQKMIPHACAFHVMRGAKKSCKKFYPGNMEYGLYSFSTILNACSLDEVEEALFDMAVVLQGRKLTPEVIEASERMHQRINDLSKESKDKLKDDHVYKASTEVSEDGISSMNKTEEEFFHLAEGSHFRSWAKRVITQWKTTEDMDPDFWKTYSGSCCLHSRSGLPLCLETLVDMVARPHMRDTNKLQE